MRRKIGSPAAIQTLAQLRQTNRRLDQVRREVDRILAEMRKGASLMLHYENGHPIWRLTSGRFVSSKVAEIVITTHAVVGVGNSLFPATPAKPGGTSND